MRRLCTATSESEARTLTWIGLKSLTVIALFVLGLGLTACHTVEGAGRDIQTVGEGVEETADETRPYE